MNCSLKCTPNWCLNYLIISIGCEVMVKNVIAVLRDCPISKLTAPYGGLFLYIKKSKLSDCNETCLIMFLVKNGATLVKKFKDYL